MKMLLISLLFLQFFFTGFVRANEQTYLDQFYCTDHIEKKLEKRGRLVAGKIMFWGARGLVFAAGITAGVAGAGAVAMAAGAYDIAAMGILMMGLGAGFGIGVLADPGKECMLCPYYIYRSRHLEWRLKDLKQLFADTQYSEEDLKQMYREDRIQDAIDTENYHRTSMNLPVLTAAEEQILARRVPYGPRYDTTIDVIAYKAKGNHTYQEVREYVLAHKDTDIFCPKKKNGKRRFYSLEKLGKLYTKN